MAVQGATLKVEGYQELLRAFKQADAQQRRALREILKETGERVQHDAAQTTAEEHRKSAAGYRVYVRQRGVEVEQSLRKTTGLHPEWGAWQMRHALVPALIENEDDTNRAMNRALERICATFD